MVESVPDSNASALIQEDLVRAGQRRVNLIWEYTQAIVAILIVLANIVVWLSVAFRPIESSPPQGLTDALFVIVGFYYGRTNHANTGGVGRKPLQDYVGR